LDDSTCDFPRRSPTTHPILVLDQLSPVVLDLSEGE
jgi:hypothetical protein